MSPTTPAYRQLAAELRAAIKSGAYPPGSKLPKITDLAAERGVDEKTVRQAYKLIETEGLVTVVRKGGTTVREAPVRIPLSRYGKVLTPGGGRGPWETATHDLGLDGRMTMVDVGEVPAEAGVAEALGVDEGTLVHRRRRRAMLGDQVHHLQAAWYPADVAERAGLTGAETIIGGIYGAMAGAGMRPAELDEVITARMPTPEEATELRTGGGVPLLLIERITRDESGHVVEVLHVAAPADRIELSYDHLPLKGPAS